MGFVIFPNGGLLARSLAGSVAYVEQAMPFPKDGKQVSVDVHQNYYASVSNHVRLIQNLPVISSRLSALFLVPVYDMDTNIEFVVISIACDDSVASFAGVVWLRIRLWYVGWDSDGFRV